jgi:ubiquinone/menaquinone biosynthesis C-methylase UbiE
MTDLDEVAHQRRYYAETAKSYDALHVAYDDEHFVALSWLSGVIAHHGISSVLDVGSGTGRAPAYLGKHHPSLKVVGLEPSHELRAIGYANGISETVLVDGDATRLEYEDNSFDIVCEFGVLHHLREPDVAISEMLRVARRMVFISDDNHFAAGRPITALAKRMLRRVHLWDLAYRLRTAGKGYRVSAGDGVSYAYSVFDSLDLLEKNCRRVHMMNTSSGGPALFSTASHVAILGVLQ